jgi:TolA-binding protein
LGEGAKIFVIFKGNFFLAYHFIFCTISLHLRSNLVFMHTHCGLIAKDMSKRVKTKIKVKSAAPEAESAAETPNTPDFTPAPEAEVASTGEETLLESAELLEDRISKSQEYLERNRNIVMGVAAAIVLAIVAAFGFNWYMGEQEETAQGELASAVFLYEKDSLDKALNGDGNSTLGLLSVSEEYSSTKAGNLANFYAGVIYLKKGDFDNAIKHLEEFSASDVLISARAASLLGDAYMEKENYEQAITHYEKASSKAPNEEFTPTYLMKLALACELKQDSEKAKNAYKRIITEFPNSRDVNSAKKYLAKLE